MKTDLFNLFVCPKTREPLFRQGNILSSGNSSISQKYKIMKGKPILVDSESSIIDTDKINKQEFSSEVRRYKSNHLTNILRKVVNPVKIETRKNIKLFVKNLPESQSNEIADVLIVGSAKVGQGLDDIFENERINTIGFDIYLTENVDFIADAHQIPLKNSSVDGVIVQAVLEHVLDPKLVVKEIHRVLKPNGIVYAETPFLQQVHEGAFDFTRFTERGHRYLFKEFEQIASGILGGPGTVMNWNLDYFFRGLFRSRTIGKLFKLIFFWFIYLDFLFPKKFSVDNSSGSFFLGSKSNYSLTNKKLKDGYIGEQTI